MNTESRPVESVSVGDVIETEDGFQLFYMRVTKPLRMDGNDNHRWYVAEGVMVGGEDDGEPGELYLNPGETAEVAS